jgi:hypothetical protein
MANVIHNPIIILLVLLSLPRLWHGLRNRGAPMHGSPASPEQKWTMGLSYLALGGFLAWMMAHTFEHPSSLR